MLATAHQSGIFNHPTARGDGREQIVTGFLRERLGTEFGACKAEVVDGNGQTTGKIDCAVYDQTVGASLHAEDTRRVIRVETLEKARSEASAKPRRATGIIGDRVRGHG